MPPGVEVPASVPGAELASLYRRTACLVFPSLYEGFGQPPLEAMASAAPVAASNIPAIAEVAGTRQRSSTRASPRTSRRSSRRARRADRFAAAGPAGGAVHLGRDGPPEIVYAGLT